MYHHHFMLRGPIYHNHLNIQKYSNLLPPWAQQGKRIPPWQFQACSGLLKPQSEYIHGQSQTLKVHIGAIGFSPSDFSIGLVSSSARVTSVKSPTRCVCQRQQDPQMGPQGHLGPIKIQSFSADKFSAHLKQQGRAIFCEQAAGRSIHIGLFLEILVFAL